MSAAVMTQRIAKVLPRFRARMAGALYLLSVATAACTEIFLRGRLNAAGGLVANAGMAAVTLILYTIFKPVNKRLALLATFFNFVGLSFEALRLNPRGVDVALVFTGFYCLLIGYLMFRSTFVPRILGALMAFAGLGWLTYGSNPLVNYLSPYNLASALVAEASVFLWLLALGLNAPKRQEKPGTWRMGSVARPR
jgi:hypothetical protein